MPDDKSSSDANVIIIRASARSFDIDESHRLRNRAFPDFTQCAQVRACPPTGTLSSICDNDFTYAIWPLFKTGLM